MGSRRPNGFSLGEVTDLEAWRRGRFSELLGYVTTVSISLDWQQYSIVPGDSYEHLHVMRYGEKDACCSMNSGRSVALTTIHFLISLLQAQSKANILGTGLGSNHSVRI